MHITTATSPPDAADDRQVARIRRAITKHSFAVLSSASEAGHPHAAGVVYDAVTTTLYVNTLRTSRKARNVLADGRVGVVIPVRRVPVGPPFSIQFQARATMLAMDDPEITALLARGSLKTTAAHGALDEPDGCFLRIEPTGRIHSYGIGVPILAVARDPLHNGARSVLLPG